MELFDRRTAPRRADTWFVYGLVDSRDPEKIRYIGITNNPRGRLAAHVSASRESRERGHKSSWIYGIIRSGADVVMIFLARGLSQERAATAEIDAIAKYRALGCRLTNTADGGLGGMAGATHSLQARQKIGLASSARPRSEKTKAALSETFRVSGPQENSTSGYKGVSFDIQRQKWNARITIGGKRIKIGRFPTPELAALAYDRAAFEAWGGDCYLNFFPVAMTASQENTSHARL